MITIHLTKRQREALACIAAGMTREAVARHLHVSPDTAKHFLRAVYEKLDAHNAAQAVARGYETGQLPADVHDIPRVIQAMAARHVAETGRPPLPKPTAGGDT